jgi:hypothetical protein
VLADDLRRLPSAARDAYAAVRHLLGAPAEPAGRPGHRSLDYDIGPERSFVVIHNEYLSVVFGRLVMIDLKGPGPFRFRLGSLVPAVLALTAVGVAPGTSGGSDPCRYRGSDPV